MPDIQTFRFSLFLLIIICVGGAVSTVCARPATANAAPFTFTNPVIKNKTAECAAHNLNAEKFSSQFSPEDRLKLCQGFDKIAAKLNSNIWSAALAAELRQIWQIFSDKVVDLRPLPNDSSSRLLAMAEPFPKGNLSADFEACVYVRPGKASGEAFFRVLFHELRHVYDFYETWKNKGAISSLETERRAFLLMGKIARESAERSGVPGIPNFWSDSWSALSESAIELRRTAAVDEFLRKNKYYRKLDSSGEKLDFISLRRPRIVDSEWRTEEVDSKKEESDRLPARPPEPNITETLRQNIEEADFKLERPKNPRDEKEILRVALANEKNLYRGMSNFVYDRKLNFQCWKEGKIVSQTNETTQIARSRSGESLIHQPLVAVAPPCAKRYADLQTDFTETFWASPALEKMPITFAGFQTVEGRVLARYTVLKPAQAVFNQLALEYALIKPFRVFVGTIFVSPEDGQIVKFWGTSYPEDDVTGNEKRMIFASYSVTALRQRLNINDGVWVTVHIGTSAVAGVGINPQPFRYTVRFENYRQAATDVRVLDDAEPAKGGQR